VLTIKLDAGIRGTFEQLKTKIKSIEEAVRGNNILPQNELNRRLGITQDYSNNINKLKKNYEETVLSSIKVVSS
jgi:hypothetical protein